MRHEKTSSSQLLFVSEACNQQQQSVGSQLTIMRRSFSSRMCMDDCNLEVYCNTSSQLAPWTCDTSIQWLVHPIYAVSADYTCRSPSATCLLLSLPFQRIPFLLCSLTYFSAKQNLEDSRDQLRARRRFAVHTHMPHPHFIVKCMHLFYLVHGPARRAGGFPRLSWPRCQLLDETVDMSIYSSNRKTRKQARSQQGKTSCNSLPLIIMSSSMTGSCMQLQCVT